MRSRVLMAQSLKYQKVEYGRINRVWKKLTTRLSFCQKKLPYIFLASALSKVCIHRLKESHIFHPTTSYRFEGHNYKLKQSSQHLILWPRLKTHDNVPPCLHTYFISVVDWASTFPSGVTKKGIWPNGGRPARNNRI